MDAAPAPDVQGGAARRRAGRAARLGAWYRRHVWTITAVAILVVLAAGFAVVQVLAAGRVGEGVSAAGVPLQGLDRGAAEAAVKSRLAAALSSAEFTVSGRRISLPPAKLGISLNGAATAAAAYERGRHRLPLGLQVWLPGGGGEVMPVLRVSPAAFERGLAPLRAAADVAPKDARLRLSGQGIMVVPAVDGSKVDAAALAQALRASIAAGRPYSGPVPMTAVRPAVSTADASARSGIAARYLAQPLTLRLRTHRVVLTPAMMARMLSITTGASSSQYPLTFDNPRAERILHHLFAGWERPPVDAGIVVLPQGGIRVTQSREGARVDVSAVAQDLDAAAAGGGLRTVFVPLTATLPRLTTDDLRTSGLAALGTQFTTYFDVRNTARARNIALAAKAVDGSVVAPGAVFSLNAAMGPRTRNRGFDYAPVIAADGVLRPGVGGGICQYATTLFNAVFFAGLPVVERHPHLIYLSHYPTGRDATVSWGGPDFKFRNDTAKPLTIRSWVDGGGVTVAIVGKTGRSVSDVTGRFTDITRPAHTKADPRVIYDATLPKGMVRWETGEDGRSVKVVRTVRDGGGAVLFRDTFVSVYAPLDWVKRVGPG